MKKKSMVSRLFALVLCILMILSSFSGTVTLAGTTAGTRDHIADGIINKSGVEESPSMDSYKDLISLRNESRRAGRVWADKSVFTDSVTLDMDTDGIDHFIDADGNETDPIIMNESDFLHVFSTLGSSQMKQVIQPLDVVFILDTSASMSSQGENERFCTEDTPEDNESNKNPRLEYAADALNDAMEFLMESTYNRVALVTFNLGAETVMELGRYKPNTVERTPNESGGYRNGESRYFTIAQCSYTGSLSNLEQTNYDNRFEQLIYNNRFQDNGGLAADWKVIEINATPVDSNSGRISSSYNGYKNGKTIPAIHTSSGTDTAWGIIRGMQILANASETKLKLYRDSEGNLSINGTGKPDYEIQRQPIIVMLTDGAPNPSSTGTNGYAVNWWNGTGTMVGKDSIARYDEANGLLVAATAAYQKQQVEKHYFGSLPANPGNKDGYNTLVFNFGICMDDPDATKGVSASNENYESLTKIAYDGQIALAGLNPSCLEEASMRNTYPYLNTIYNWWNTYKNGGSPLISVDWDKDKNKTKSENNKGVYTTYVMTHPTSDDITSLDYPTTYEDIHEPSKLRDQLVTTLEGIIDPEVFTPVLGTNDIISGDYLTYMDPIGQYMEVKTVKNVLLFGQLYNVAKFGNEKYYDANGNELKNSKNSIYSRQYYRITNDETITNPCYKDGVSEKYKFKLSEIEIYVQTSGTFIDQDTGGGLESDLGYDQALYVNIPAKALPMQVATITLGPNKMFMKYETNIGDDEKVGSDVYIEKKQQSTPLRVFYEVGIADDIKNKNGKVDLTQVSPDYITTHKSEDGEKIYFYSNWYNDKKDPYNDYVTESGSYTFGDPVLTFSPSLANRYYMFENARLLFENPDEDTKGGVLEVNGKNVSLNGEPLSPVTSKVDSDKWYYVMIEYYDKTGLVRRALPRLGSEFGSGIGGTDGGASKNAYLCWYDPINDIEADYTEDENGNVKRPGTNYYVAARKYGLRVGDMSAGIGNKDAFLDENNNKIDTNNTGTSETYYMPTVSSSTKGEEDGDVIINLYLGNNGRLAVTNTQLLVTKTVDTIGADSEDLEKAFFNYTIELTDPELGKYTGEFNAIKATRESNGTTWRALIETIELLTSNQGILQNVNGTLAAVDLDSDGNIIVDKDGKVVQGTSYYLYVGGDASDGFTYTLFDSSKDSFNGILGTGKDLTVTVYLVPVDDFDNNWSFSNSAKLKAIDKFVVGRVGFDKDDQIGFAAKLNYQSKTTYQTKTLNFENGSADFQLRDGEGLLFIGLDLGTDYTVTEKLTDKQVNESILIKSVTHKEKNNTTVYYPDAGARTYAVSGQTTTATMTEEVNFFNYLPKTEKFEIEHAEDGYVKIGDELTYVIYWENYAMNEKGEYIKADVIVTDPLDKGVDFISDSAEFLEIKDDGSVEKMEPVESDYNETDRIVSWHIKATPGQSGYVMFKVTVNENADTNWNYEDKDTKPGNDYKVLNRASVRVGNDGKYYNEIFTEIVETDTGVPHKTETAVNGDDVSGNLKEDQTSGNLVGPLVNDKEEIEYSISYVNYKDTAATITIIDQLDPGVVFERATGGDATLAKPSTSAAQGNVSIAYDAAAHTVTWVISNVPNLTAGKVTLAVTVNEKEAVKGWNYTKADGIEGDVTGSLDYKIFNRASVQVADDKERITETIENPLPSPVIDFPSVGGIGTDLFYMFGGVLFIGAALLLVIKAKKSKLANS